MIRHVYGDRFPLGEPSGEISADVERLSAAFVAAGMQAPVLDRIRDEIWLKLWGNVCLNPITRPHPRHPRRDLLRSDHARAVEIDHAGDPGDRRNFRRQVPRRCRAADRRRPQGRRPQDLDAAGSRARTPDGDRSAGVGGAGNGAPDADSDAGARCRAGAGVAAARKSPGFTAIPGRPRRRQPFLPDRLNRAAPPARGSVDYLQGFLS